MTRGLGSYFGVGEGLSTRASPTPARVAPRRRDELLERLTQAPEVPQVDTAWIRLLCREYTNMHRNVHLLASEFIEHTISDRIQDKRYGYI